MVFGFIFYMLSTDKNDGNDDLLTQPRALEIAPGMTESGTGATGTGEGVR